MERYPCSAHSASHAGPEQSRTHHTRYISFKSWRMLFALVQDRISKHYHRIQGGDTGDVFGSIPRIRPKGAMVRNHFPRIEKYLAETCFLQVVESCKLLGVDLNSIRAIHIAGTKGKGSTSAMCERILRSAGFRTGLYTSPHLVDVRERFRINGGVLSKERFASYFWHAHDVLSSKGELQFFQFLTVLGFYIFTQENVDAAVIEVGLGGRLDATNALTSPVVCGITLLDSESFTFPIFMACFSSTACTTFLKSLCGLSGSC
jgi:hypothetical protein